MWDLLLALLPFLILVVFWIFLIRHARARNDPVVEKLEEIRQELGRLRRAVEQRDAP